MGDVDAKRRWQVELDSTALNTRYPIHFVENVNRNHRPITSLALTHIRDKYMVYLPRKCRVRGPVPNGGFGYFISFDIRRCIAELYIE